jgi:hypothetical protein
MIQFKSTLQKFDPKLFGFHFQVPAEIAEQFIDGNNRRVICDVNKQLKMQCALMPYSQGYFILINKTRVKQLGLRVDEEVELSLKKDNSEYGHEMPESFEMLLVQDEEGSKYFHQLTPGKKRSLIYIVGKVKNVDSQLNKGLAILEHLRTDHGQLDFKKLNELIKEYNQRSKLKH